MNENIARLLNEQINHEFYSAYLYLDIANYYDELDLDGYANYYMIQAQEERDHALLFMKYMQINGLKVTLKAIDKPDKEFNSILDPLEIAAEHERYVTALINNIYHEAQLDRDYRAMKFLDWFVDEQMEEEDIRNVLEKVLGHVELKINLLIFLHLKIKISPKSRKRLCGLFFVVAILRCASMNMIAYN